MSRNDWMTALECQNIVIHLAAETGTGQSMYEVARYTDVNIQGTAILLDILANTSHSIQKVVVASSRAVYGEGKYLSKELGVVYPSPREAVHMGKGEFEPKYPGSSSLTVLPTDEDSKLAPHSVYGITKQVQEQLVLTVCNSLGIAAVAFRYQNVYGPGQSLKNPYTGILSIFSNRIRAGKSINIFEDGLESRDFVYIDDIVGATIRGMEDDLVKNMVFNVGCGTPITVLKVVETLMSELDMKVDVQISGKFRIGDIRHNFADITRLKKVLGYTPQTDFNLGIRKFVQWVKRQPVEEDNYVQSLEEMKRKGLLK